ncbi:MAG: protein kinase [bacterium]|nr:protein kinase [bacterium]
MTGHEDPPSPPGSAPGAPEEPHDPLSEAVERFAFLVEDDPALDLEAFLADYPIDVRDDLRRHCEDARRVLSTLRRRSSFRAERPERIGEYRLEEELGRGGMGIVYRAWQESLQRWVALKVLGIHPGVTTRAIERFRREATTAGKLRHPGIVQVYAVGESDGVLWIAMEHIEGETLASWLVTRAGRRTDGDEGRDIATIAERIAQMADALEYAHGQGVIHRDIKPANVLIDSGRRARLVDFGLAKDLGELSISHSGDLAGTPHYMSPEQAAAKRSQIDHRSDIFSLGVILYECLTAARPFEGDSVQRVLFEISFKEALRVRSLRPSCPRDLETICHKALEKHPARRFQTAGELAAELRRFLNHESILSRPPGYPERMWRWAARHRVASSCAALLVLVALVFPLLAQRVAHAARKDAALEPLRTLSRIENLADAPVQSVLAAYDASVTALRDPSALSTDELALAREQSERISAYRDGLASRSVESMRTAYDPTFRTDAESRFVPFMGGLRNLVIATLLTPGRAGRPETTLEVLDRARPRLSVSCATEGAQVALVALDRFDGTPGAVTVLGTTPLVEAPFDPGYYRIVVSKEGAGSAELTRMMDEPARAHSVRARLRGPDDFAPDDLILIEDAPDEVFVFGALPDGVYHQRMATVPPFWIQATEVTNAEYRKFVAATGHAQPRFWPEVWDAALDRRPVSGVTWNDARAYAEWAGMRLPTMLEWQRAARGRNGLLHPRPLTSIPIGDYALDAPPLDLSGVDFSAPGGVTRYHELQLQRYLSHARPVDSNPDQRNADGLYHVLDNVAEWTENLMTGLDGSGLKFFKPYSRAIQGLAAR